MPAAGGNYPHSSRGNTPTYAGAVSPTFAGGVNGSVGGGGGDSACGGRFLVPLSAAGLALDAVMDSLQVPHSQLTSPGVLSWSCACLPFWPKRPPEVVTHTHARTHALNGYNRNAHMQSRAA